MSDNNKEKRKTSHNLEVISEDPPKRESRERRRLPRLSLASEQFRLGQNGKVFSVTDLSIGGLALRIIEKSDLVLFTMGTRIEGTLNLRGEKISVRARVRHIWGNMIGCEFEELESDAIDRLNRFLDPAALGAELKPIPVSEGSTLWYHGPSGTDLLLWRAADGRYRKFSLFVFGTFIQWEESSGASTGRCESSPQNGETRGIVRLETMLLSPDPSLDSGKLNIAKTLILGSNLPQDLKKWCARHLDS